jgi:hypothetical protein
MPIHKQNYYFPLEQGHYRVTPGLHAFGTDFGNSNADRLIFQFDENFEHYRQTKLSTRTEALEKYYCKEEFDSQRKSIITRFIIQQLCHESPNLFSYQKHNNQHCLQCELTGETLVFDPQYKLSGNQLDSIGYVDSLDALAMQVQEDLALLEITNDGHDRIIALHLCFPNHWAAKDKIGKSFLASHAPVPGMGKINQRAEQLLNSLLNKGPYVRFAWGLATDKYLNHHPIAPEGVDKNLWLGRRFDPTNPHLYLRVERQVIYGFPSINTFLFTIRTYFYDVATLKQSPTKRQALQSALQSMSAATLRYKGLAESLPLILDWLEN